MGFTTILRGSWLNWNWPFKSKQNKTNKNNFKKTKKPFQNTSSRRTVSESANLNFFTAGHRSLHGIKFTNFWRSLLRYLWKRDTGELDLDFCFFFLFKWFLQCEGQNRFKFILLLLFVLHCMVQLAWTCNLFITDLYTLKCLTHFFIVLLTDCYVN